jgi:predicted MPP superfamily phosphohydrolase
VRLYVLAAIVCGLVVLWHGYLWLRLVRDVTASRTRRRAGAAALAVLGFFAASAILRPAHLGAVRPYVLSVGFVWLGVGFLIACALAVAEVARAGHFVSWKVLRRDPPDAARRRALGQALGGAAVVTGGAAALAGAGAALDLVVERVRVPLRRLPAAMSGLRIVQVSDLHLGAAVGPAYLARVIAEVNALDPDLVAITGDLVDDKVEALRDWIAPIATLRSRLGVYFVTGNHEYYSGAPAWVEHLPTLGVRVLRNERVSIGEGDASFDLAGVDDTSAVHWLVGHAQDVPAALRDRDPAREVVLLAHQPVTVREAAQHGVGLQLSGHTHGGQIWPLRFLLLLDQPFVDGLHRLADTYIYVSRGTGHWGPPMRVGVRPEITEITLVRA